MVKKNMSKTSISIKKSKINLHSRHKSILVKKPAGKLWYEFLTSIFITVNMIRSSYNNNVFSFIYYRYKSILAVEIYDILMATQNRISFERLIK